MAKIVFVLHEEVIDFFTSYYVYNTTVLLSLCCCICVSSFGLFPVFPFSRLIPAFKADITDLYAKIPCYLVFYMQYCTRCASEGGRDKVPWVAWRHLWHHTRF